LEKRFNRKEAFDFVRLKKMGSGVVVRGGGANETISAEERKEVIKIRDVGGKRGGPLPPNFRKGGGRRSYLRKCNSGKGRHDSFKEEKGSLTCAT